MRRRTALLGAASALTASALPALGPGLPAGATTGTGHPAPDPLPAGRRGHRLAVMGADVSSLARSEDHGGVYRTAAGVRVDPLRLLRASGATLVRLRVWVRPADGYNTKERLLAMAARARRLGLGLMVDFHYSDTWADPGKQFKPAAWSGYDIAQLREAVYDHTFDVLHALARQGTPADLAQIGNEINGGMLWPDGDYNHWDNLAALLTAGSTAATRACPRTRVVLHLAEGGNNAGHRWWFDNATARGVPFDVIAVSHYLYWHGTSASLLANLTDLTARYDRDVMVAETAYGFTTAEDDAEPQIFTAALAEAGGWPATPAGQVGAFREICDAVAAVPDRRGLGVVYWEPTWTAVPGNGWDPADPTSGDGWENQALFDFDDRALPALRVFGEY